MSASLHRPGRAFLSAWIAAVVSYAVFGGVLGWFAVRQRHLPFASPSELVLRWAGLSALTGVAVGVVVGLATAWIPRRRWRVVLAAVLLLGSLEGIRKWGRAARDDPRPPRAVAVEYAPLAQGDVPAGAPNVVLVTIDTLRADHLGLYGYARDTSPFLDAFAGRGVVFEQVIAQAPATERSMASLHTGLLPTVLDVEVAARGRDGPFVGAGFHTLAERLGARGWATAGFVSNTHLVAGNGFAQGFDVYDDATLHGAGAVTDLPTIDAVLDPALAWLAAAPRPFFLWIHVMDPHHPYVPQQPGPWEDVADVEHGRLDAAYRALSIKETTRRLDDLAHGRRSWEPGEFDYLVGRYDAAISQVDRGLSRLVLALDEHGLAATTVVAVTADHGEEFLDHGRLLHSYTLYDEMLHVPLVLAGPGVPRGVRVSAQAPLVDLCPTLLDLAGVELDGLDGRSLVPLFTGEEHTARPALAMRSTKYMSLRTGSEKLVVAYRPYDDGRDVRGPWDMSRLVFGRTNRPKVGLWRLGDDPREQDDCLASERVLARRLYDELAAELASHPPRRVASVTSSGLTESEREALRALGYVR